eukprot:3409244-Prymnesium_polylepis.1
MESAAARCCAVCPPFWELVAARIPSVSLPQHRGTQPGSKTGRKSKGAGVGVANKKGAVGRLGGGVCTRPSRVRRPTSRGRRSASSGGSRSAGRAASRRPCRGRRPAPSPRPARRETSSPRRRATTA